MLVRGIFDGVLYGESPKMRQYLPPERATFLQEVQALDQFYANALNQQVPVFFALHIVATELKGASRDSTDALTRYYRVWAARPRQGQ